MTLRRGRQCLAAALLTAATWTWSAAQSGPSNGLTLAGEFLVPPGTSFPNIGPSRFGGISALVAMPSGCEFLGLSDDHDDPRVYRLRLSGAGKDMQVRPIQRIQLRPGAGAPEQLDPEGIAITKTGSMLVSSEGRGTEPRLPPAILEYAADGRFIRLLPVPPKFIPNARGPLRTGVRSNGGFETLTLSTDSSRLYTANEIPLVQDGPESAFAEGQRVRILEYTAENGNYVPEREFAYQLSPLDRPQTAYGFAVNGLVELLPITATEFYALERGFVQVAGSRIGFNRIRLFRILLEGATDVAGLDTLAAPEVKPVRKTLVQDFSQLPGRSLRLLNLENFEGLAWVGNGEGADRGLLMVSDDNFNALQVTAFLLLSQGAGLKPCATGPD